MKSAVGGCESGARSTEDRRITPKRVPASRKQTWSWQLKIELLGVTPSVRYADPDPDFADELDHVDQKNVVLVNALGIDSRRFDYVYDFGDDWHHIVIVEEQIPNQDIAPSLIHCSGGANRCPPEDVGSTRGYAEFLEAISDPEHEEHDRYRHWCGGHFDPTRFDIDATNLALSKIKI
jgi:Plasmid pRiA4b ORF-3-like protein